MIGREQDEASVSRLGSPAKPEETLPYRIELWGGADRTVIERVLARAFSPQLARAIFKAASSEHPGRRVTLSRGSRILADSAG